MDQTNQSDEYSDISKEKILNVCQKVAVKLEQIRTLHLSGSKKIENATEDSIRQFSSLIDRVDMTIDKATEIMEAMKKKISVIAVRESIGKKSEQGTVIREKYEALLKDVIEQLSLIIRQRSEDITRLETLREKIGLVANEAGNLFTKGDAEQDTGKIGKELNSIHHFIKEHILSLKETVDIETRFILSTFFILQDLVLSLVDSVVQLSVLMDNTLGESSSVGDEISAIIVNFQCEDICSEMSRHTIEILSSILRDLQNVNGVVDDNGFTQMDEKEMFIKSEFADSEEEVIFFDG